VDGTFPGIENVIQSFWHGWIYSINVISQDNGEIYLRTFFLFSNEKFGDEVSLKIINNFDLKNPHTDIR